MVSKERSLSSRINSGGQALLFFIDHLFQLFKFCLEEPQVFGFIDHF